MKTFHSILGILTVGLFIFLIWPNKEIPEQKTETPDKTKVIREEVKLHKPDRGQKLATTPPAVKPRPSEKEDEKLTAKVPVSIDPEYIKKMESLVKDGYGKMPEISMTENMNPQKKSVIEAIKTGQYPERLSIMAKREPFDYETYKRDPESYLNVVIPSRVYETAQPGEGVKRLTRIGPGYLETIQNEPVTLTIEGAEPGAPVSATAFDGGHFQNDLSAITVRADNSGMATLTFTPTDGVIENCRISAASPLSSGLVQFTVYVNKKDTKGKE